MKRGQKPRPPALRGIKGGKRSDNTENPASADRRTEPLKPPKRLTKVQQQIWDEHIEPAWWIQQCDVPLAYLWVVNYAQFLNSPEKMIASHQAEMRKQYHQLSLSSSEQVRIGVHEAEGGRGTGRFFSSPAG